MATNAALMLAFTIVTMLLPLIVGQRMALRLIRRKRGEQVAARRQDVTRFVIVTTTAASMCGAVLFMAPQTIAPDMLPGAASAKMSMALAQATQDVVVATR